MKLRAYLVDDEPLALQRLKRLLDQTGRVEITGFTTDPEEAIEALKSNTPDVCFLDIQMDYTIAELEKKLDPKKFVRIHRSTLLNVDWIKEITSLPGGGLNVRLKDGKDTDLIVARDRARELKARLGC